jgi:hypothetical protein
MLMNPLPRLSFDGAVDGDGHVLEPPSVYFRRQCWISGDPDETSLAAIIPGVGADRFFWASDFPHPDHPPQYVPELTRLVHALPAEARVGFLGGNVLTAYGIER